MNTNETGSDKPKSRWCQYNLWQLLVVVTIFSVLLSCYAWFRYAVAEPLERSYQVLRTVHLLSKKCPPTMNPKQWEVAAEWTANLTANSALASEANLKDLRRFQSELDERMKGNVDMDTILWIWDQHAILTPTGKKYNERYRQVMFDQMQ